MIDWAQPCETTETPPRPVRVLATDLPGKHSVLIHYAVSGIAWCSPDGSDIISATSSTVRFRLRNVPAKPVRHEAWVGVYRSQSGDVEPSAFFATEDRARAECQRAEAIVKCVWNSDGSPVDDGLPVLASDYDQTIAEWRTKSEALQAEVADWEDRWNERIKAAQNTLDRRRINETEALKSEIERQRAAHEAQVNRLLLLIDGEKYHRKQAEERAERMKPVVDAAVAYADADNSAQCHAAYVLFREVVHVYQSTIPATSDSHDALVQDFLDLIERNKAPLKECKACRHYPSDDGGTCHDAVGECYFYAHWEATSHD